MNVNVRFPESIRDRVRAFANLDRRSMNAEILRLLEEAMDARDASARRPSEFRYPTADEHASGRLMRAAERAPAPPDA